MTAHDWELQRADVGSSLQTRLDWRCANCRSDTFTTAPSNVGSHGARAFAPGKSAPRADFKVGDDPDTLQVDPDCAQATVDGVHRE